MSMWSTASKRTFWTTTIGGYFLLKQFNDSEKKYDDLVKSIIKHQENEFAAKEKTITEKDSEIALKNRMIEEKDREMKNWGAK